MVLRPLSGRLLPPTLMEANGVIDRNMLLDLSGRSRKRQFRLARELGINVFESPSGGCLLTDKQFSVRVRPFLDRSLGVDEIKAFRIGRHFLINGIHFVVSRNESENRRIRIMGGRYPLICASNGRGACGVFFEVPREEDKTVAAAIIMRYSKKADGVEYCFSGECSEIVPKTMLEQEIDDLMVR